MFKSNIANDVSTMIEIYISNPYNPDKSFGIYSPEISNDVLDEVNEYIKKNIVMQNYYESFTDNIFNQAVFEITGKKELDMDDLDNEELRVRIDSRYDELFRNCFGDISDAEFDERIAALNSYEYFDESDVAISREIKIFGKELK